MKFCNSCGKEIDENTRFCAECGADQGGNQRVQVQQSNDDTGSFGWSLLGFCIPIVGLVLYLVWLNDKPLNAKAAGKGALAYVIFAVVMYVIVFIFMGASMAQFG